MSFLLNILGNKWTYIALFILAIFIVVLIFINTIQNYENTIDNLEEHIDNLTISNTLLNDDILKLSNDMKINKSFSNTVIKIIHRTNDIYYTNKDDIDLKLDKRNDFYNLFISNKLGAVK